MVAAEPACSVLIGLNPSPRCSARRRSSCAVEALNVPTFPLGGPSARPLAAPLGSSVDAGPRPRRRRCTVTPEANGPGLARAKERPGAPHLEGLPKVAGKGPSRNRAPPRARPVGRAVTFHDARSTGVTYMAEVRSRASKSAVFSGKFSGGAGNRTRVRKASSQPSFTCVATIDPVTGLRGFGHDLATCEFQESTRQPDTRPSLSADALPLPRQSHGWTALRFFTPRERLRYRSQLLYGPLSRWCRRHRTQIGFQSPRRNRSPPKRGGGGGGPSEERP